MESFGEYIRRLRTEVGYTLTQLGAKLNIDSAGLSKIETGHKKLKPEKLSLLAEIFNLDLEEIKNQYYGEEIAIKLYQNNCSEVVLTVAEEKMKYLKAKSAKQKRINF